jgi:hypothetical protein
MRPDLFFQKKKRNKNTSIANTNSKFLVPRSRPETVLMRSLRLLVMMKPMELGIYFGLTVIQATPSEFLIDSIDLFPSPKNFLLKPT